MLRTPFFLFLVLFAVSFLSFKASSKSLREFKQEAQGELHEIGQTVEEKTQAEIDRNRPALEKAEKNLNQIGHDISEKTQQIIDGGIALSEEIVDKNSRGTKELGARLEAEGARLLEDGEALGERAVKNVANSAQDVAEGVEHATEQLKEELNPTEPTENSQPQVLQNDYRLLNLPSVDFVTESNHDVLIEPNLEHYYYSIDGHALEVQTEAFSLYAGAKLEKIETLENDRALAEELLTAFNGQQLNQGGKKLCARISSFNVEDPKNETLKVISLHQFYICPTAE